MILLLICIAVNCCLFTVVSLGSMHAIYYWVVMFGVGTCSRFVGITCRAFLCDGGCWSSPMHCSGPDLQERQSIVVWRFLAMGRLKSAAIVNRLCSGYRPPVKVDELYGVGVASTEGSMMLMLWVNCYDMKQWNYVGGRCFGCSEIIVSYPY